MHATLRGDKSKIPFAEFENWSRLPLDRGLQASFSGRSAAWLARYLGVVEVVGSNPAGPIFLALKWMGESRE